MWSTKSKSELNSRLSGTAAISLLLSFMALVVSLGVARWTWLVMDEQIELRQDYADLRNEMSQTGIQYEYWLSKLQAEREAAK